MSDSINDEERIFELKMANEKDKSEKKSAEKRSGEYRRKFSFGYKGPERRSGSDRREKDKP
ncbi:MAG: hypothetical protein NTW93_08580 [Phycisphaerae bacterium]|nr:hypothetical protein [Phycisphaerae bacterium]